MKGTFVEDLLDTGASGDQRTRWPRIPDRQPRACVRRDALRARSEDLQYLEIRVGGQIMFGSSAPGEIDPR